MLTHEPCLSFGTEWSSSTLKSLATFNVSGLVAGGSGRFVAGRRLWAETKETETTQHTKQR